MNNLSPELKEQLIKICTQIAEDTEKDVKEFDGKPFNGKTIGTCLGYQGAAIKALAEILERLIRQS